jgi:hypothetical protein
MTLCNEASSRGLTDSLHQTAKGGETQQPRASYQARKRNDRRGAIASNRNRRADSSEPELLSPRNAACEATALSFALEIGFVLRSKHAVDLVHAVTVGV